MKTIIFVCHGNICRSPAGEYICKHLVNSLGRSHEFNIFSRAVSLEEIGNDIYYPMKRELIKNNIPINRHYAKRISQSDYDKADYIFYMDSSNKYYLDRMFNDERNIIKHVNVFSSGIGDIEDPWYTGRFDVVVSQITKCVQSILENIGH